MVDAGRLRHKITICQFDGTVDSYGQPMDMVDANWDAVATVWAAVEPVSGREFYENSQSQTEITHNVRLRWRSGIKAAMRIKFGARRLEIKSVIDRDERHEELLLKCKELIE